MKLLLHADIEKLGYFGDVVEVNNSYARNYLLPQRLAVVPTDEAVAAIEAERAERAEQRRLAQEALMRVAEAVNGTEITIEALANEQGHLFGSVSQAEISKALIAKGFDVQSRHVVMDYHLREVGSHEVHLHFAQDVDATVRLTIVNPEDQASDGDQQQPDEPVSTEVPAEEAEV